MGRYLTVGLATLAWGATALAAKSSLSANDHTFINEAAQGGMLEVQLGERAATQAQNNEVKQFGQQMVTDHTKLNEQVAALAQSKGITLPTALSPAQKKEVDRLGGLEGATFDREYMRAMVKNHQKDVAAFSKAAKTAKDGDVQSLAKSALPTLQEHLKMAKSLSTKLKSPGVGGAGAPPQGKTAKQRDAVRRGTP